MGELSVHANEVRDCKACYARIVLLKNAYNKYSAFNVPATERGKSWLSIDDKDFHDCKQKERLAFLKEQKARR